MSRKFRITALIGVCSVLFVSAAVIVGIEFFGEQKVAAFGSVMSFIAAAVAATAAVGYLIETSEIVKATQHAAKQQARVASIMEADLRFRIAPNLRFRPMGGDVRDRPAEIENIGRGVAVDAVAFVTYLPTNRKQQIRLDQWMEPNKPASFHIGQMNDEPRFEVEMSCTDSVGLNTYCFRVDADGATVVVVQPRRPEGVPENPS
jgi:hypothetical protein